MLQKFGRLSQAKLNEELHAGDADMLFEKVHKMSSAVATNISQMINCQLLLIMKTDVINNISDLIVYLKFFDKKLSSQFLCQLLDENSEDYYTLCSIGYYIIGYESRYKVVLNYLFKTIMNFIRRC